MSHTQSKIPRYAKKQENRARNEEMILDYLGDP